MDCPACRQVMIVMELDEVEIDHCLECQGIWLDAGELELLLEGSKGKDELLASFIVESHSNEKPRRCPICLKKMSKVECGQKKKVLIDKCRRNDGLWFDAGELKQIIMMGSFGEDHRTLDLLKDMFGKKIK